MPSQSCSRLGDLPETNRNAYLRTLGVGRIAVGHHDYETMVQQVAVLEGLPYALDPIAPRSPTMEVYIIDAADPTKPVEWPL